MSNWRADIIAKILNLQARTESLPSGFPVLRLGTRLGLHGVMMCVTCGSFGCPKDVRIERQLPRTLYISPIGHLYICERDITAERCIERGLMSKRRKEPQCRNQKSFLFEVACSAASQALDLALSWGLVRGSSSCLVR